MRGYLKKTIDASDTGNSAYTPLKEPKIMNRMRMWVKGIVLAAVVILSVVPCSNAQGANSATAKKKHVPRLTPETYQRLREQVEKQRVDPWGANQATEQTCTPTWESNDPCGHLQSGG